MKPYKIIVDAKRLRTYGTNTIEVKQGDKDSRVVNAIITDDGVPLDLTGKTVTFYAIKPDKTKIFNYTTIKKVSDGEIEFNLTTQVLAVEGLVKGELVVFGADGSKLTSALFIIEVIKSINDESAIESQNEFTLLKDALTKLTTWDNQFETKYNGLEQEYATELTTVKSQLAETANDTEDLKRVKADKIYVGMELSRKADQLDIDYFNNRVDEIITTPVEGITEQEIIDARQGKASIGANISSVKSRLSEHREIIKKQQNKQAFADILFSEEYEKLDIIPPAWEMGTFGISNGLTSSSIYRVRTVHFMYVEEGTILEIPDNAPYELMIYMYRSNTHDEGQYIKYYNLAKKHVIEMDCYIKIVVAIDSTTDMSSHLEKAPLDVVAYRYKDNGNIYGQFELGTLLPNTGLNYADETRIRLVNPIMVEKNTVFSLNGHLANAFANALEYAVYMYDLEGNYLGWTEWMETEYSVTEECLIRIVIKRKNEGNLKGLEWELPQYVWTRKEITPPNMFGGFELGTFVVGTGVKYANNARIRTKSPVQVDKNTVFLLSGDYENEIEYALYMYDMQMNYLGWTDWLSKSYHIDKNINVNIAIRKQEETTLAGLELVLPQSLTSMDSFQMQTSSIDNQNSYIVGDFDEFYVSRPMEDVSIGTDFVLVNSKHTDIYDRYDALMNTYPRYISKKLLGHATGTDGNPNEDLSIYEYHFKNPMDNNNLNETPTILILNGVHGGEKSTTWSTLKFFENLFEFWQENETLESLKSNLNFKVVPILNPAGYNAHTRKNARGVDLNRNFGYKWGSGGSDPANWNYRGEGAFSELESQIAHAWMEENVNAFAFIDYHNTMHTDIYSYMTSHTVAIEKSYSNLMKRFYNHWYKTYGIDISEQTREYLAKNYYNMPIASNHASEEVGIKNASLLEICQYDQAQGNKENTGPVIERGIEMLVNHILMMLKNFKY